LGAEFLVVSSSGGLVVIYCFSFCLSWKIFIATSILMTILLGRVS
jgi:hypothetical protein